MDKDKFTLHCERCNETWTQEAEGLGDVDWKCPVCKLDDEVAMLEYKPGDPDFYNRKIHMGRGGAMHS